MTIPKRAHTANPLGDLLDFQKRPLAMLLEMAREYPALLRIRFAHLPHFVANDPATIGDVLQKRARDYHKEPRFMAIARDLLNSDDNLFTSDADPWLKRRRLMQPSFHRKIIAAWTTLIQQEAITFADSWQTMCDIDMEHGMMDITMAVIGQTMLSRAILKDYPQLHQAFSVTTERTIARTTSIVDGIVPIWVPTAKNRAFHEAIEIIRGIFATAIAERQLLPDAERPHDLLTLLLAARDDETGFTLNNEQLMDELYGIVDAGHETSSVALAWLLYELAANPAVQNKLCAEFAAVWAAETVTAEMVMGLPYLTAVINETLRRYPSAYATTRQAITETEITGEPIAAKTRVLVNIYGVHHHPDYWQDPMRFDPDRWQRDEIHKNSFIPFLIGPRKCIGEPLAQLEMRLVVLEVLRRYQIMPATRSSTLTTQFTLRSDDGIWVQLHTR